MKQAVKAFWFRATGWKFFTASGVLLASVLALIAAGDRSWFVGLTSGVFVLAVIFASALYIVHYRASIGRLRRMGTPEATLVLDDQTFRVTTDLGSSEFAWSVITQVWKFSDFWLVFFSPAQFLTVPLADFDEEARSFLLEKVRANGGKIR